MNQYRQGDVLLVRVDELPGKIEEIDREKGRLVLARGEATGHAHVVRERRSRLVRDAEGETFLDVAAPAKLEHEEHGPIALEPGVYKVIRQREYSQAEVRFVAD